MKNFNKFTRLLLLACMCAICIAPCHSSYAQSGTTTNNAVMATQVPKACGGYIIDTVALQLANAYGANNSNSLLPTTYTIRLYFHICRDDNGSNAAMAESVIKNELNTLIFDFAGNNICFINMGFDFIDNTALNNMNPINSSMVTPHLVPNCLNIFYHKQVGNAGGSAYGIPNSYCSIDDGNIGSSHTISHEVGHCMGLLHTHETAYGYETINGSNAGIAGDQLTDTPADPYAYQGQPCFTTSGSSYTGTCTDPNGQSAFNPPYTNLMAYWWALGNPPISITTGQYSRTNTYLATYPGLIDCESASNYTINGTVTFSSGHNMLSAINTINTNGTVVFNGSTVSTLGGALVSLQPGFRASPASGGLILMRPSICLTVPFKEHETVLVDDGTNQISSTIKCYPNPFTTITRINFNLPKDAIADIKIFNAQMKLVAHPIINSLQEKGEHTFDFSANCLPSGIYFVILNDGITNPVSKMILSK